MDLLCPNCHKHEISIVRILWLGTGRGYSGSDDMIICPRCGKGIGLAKGRETIINLVTIVVPLLLGLFAGTMLADHGGIPDVKFFSTVLLIGCAIAARFLAVRQFAVLAPVEAPSEDDENSVPDETISLTDIDKELRRLRDIKSAEFTILYEPHGKYMSMYCRKGRFIIELAFATQALRRMEEKFKSAIRSLGKTATEFDTSGMVGYEADLGPSLEGAANDVRQIFTEVFNIPSDTMVAISRD